MCYENSVLLAEEQLLSEAIEAIEDERYTDAKIMMRDRIYDIQEQIYQWETIDEADEAALIAAVES